MVGKHTGVDHDDDGGDGDDGGGDVDDDDYDDDDGCINSEWSFQNCIEYLKYNIIDIWCQKAKICEEKNEQKTMQTGQIRIMHFWNISVNINITDDKCTNANVLD